jgi:AraC-like DNA-binding protein
VLLRQILHIVQSNYYTHKAVDYLTTSLFIELTNEIFEVKEKNSAPPSPEQERLERILSIIDLQLYKNPSLRYISDMLNYNQDYLSRFFKKHMGMSIKQYIHLQQMEEAKKLLLQTNDTIKEIAYHIGFTDEKYFVRIFKKEEGITPSQYRYSYYQGLQS